MDYCDDPNNQNLFLITLSNIKRSYNLVRAKHFTLTQHIMYIIDNSPSWFEFDKKVAHIEDFGALLEYGISEPMRSPDLDLNWVSGYQTYKKNR